MGRDLSLPRAAAARARVTLVNGLGQPVAGATVTGAWSGVITTGDTTSTPGNAGFCVSGVTAPAVAYEPGQNVGTCDSIAK